MAAAGTVRDWMTRTPVSVPPDASVEQVARRMRSEGIRHILVMDGERLAGIVSHRDVRAPLIEGEPRPLASSPVATVMTEAPVTVDPDTSVTDAAREMLDRKIGALPVLEDDRPIGILTRADVLEALLAWAERVEGPGA
jgi:CBS domain-containing protein